MRRFWNSLQFQLYAALALLAIILTVAVYLVIRVSDEARQQQQTTEIAASQSANVYLLASLLRRYESLEGDSELRTSILGSIQNTIEDVRSIQRALREGDETLGLAAITDVTLLPLLEDTEREWDEYIADIEAYLESESNEIDTSIGEFSEEEAAFITVIENQSVVVYTYTDRLVNGLEIGLENQLRFVQNIDIALAIFALFALIVAIVVVTRTSRAVDSLSSTAQEFARGRLESRANTETFNEIADVGSVLNNMAERLGATIHELENKAQEAQEARLKAERSDEVKSAFLASMSHELRTPLNSIINFSKFVVRGMMGPVTERQEETLNKVVASGQHLLSLINDVLDMSKIESGSLNLFVEDDVDMKAIVDTVITNSQSLLNEKSVSLSANLPENLPLLRGDKKRLTQIMFNLVSNACKFTEEGSVLVTVESKDKEILIAVKDTGPGIAEEDRAAVFEAFKQTRSGLRSGEGTGLGMPISKSLVEAHGGRLWFDSVVGEGTSFYVSLPIKSEQLVPVKL